MESKSNLQKPMIPPDCSVLLVVRGGKFRLATSGSTEANKLRAKRIAEDLRSAIKAGHIDISE